jgi:DNA-binding CsgD family transcriptional regulator
MECYPRKVSQIAALGDLQDLTSETLGKLGFSSFMLRTVNRSHKNEVFGDFDWHHLAYYKSHRCDLVDPVARQVDTSWCPVIWDSHDLSGSPDGRCAELFQRILNIGYERGVSFRINGPFAQRHIFVGVFDGGATKFNKSRQALSNDVMVLGTHLAEAYQRISGETVTPHTSLTPRESEALLWTCRGKTAWETATIIGVTERTITFHLHNAMTKLRVRTKYAACLKALELGLILWDS